MYVPGLLEVDVRTTNPSINSKRKLKLICPSLSSGREFFFCETFWKGVYQVGYLVGFDFLKGTCNGLGFFTIHNLVFFFTSIGTYLVLDGQDIKMTG